MDCCQTKPDDERPGACPRCGQTGRPLESSTPRAQLRPSALARLEPGELRFCPTASCAVVYFGSVQVFELSDVAVPVFQKAPPGMRTVCYCFDVSEKDLRVEVEATGTSAALARISRLVHEGRCACELRNPQGSCCLGNVQSVVRALESLRAARPKE